MKYPNKVAVKTASPSKTSTLPIEFEHISTTQFMKLNVGMCYEAVPGAKFEMLHKQFLRMNPVLTPVMGTIYMKSRTYFVPYRTVWPAFNDFITRNVHQFDGGTSLPSKVPQIKMSEISKFFISPYNGLTLLGAANDHDFTYYDGTSYQSGKFTALGRYMYSILVALGYQIDWYAGVTIGSDTIPDYSVSAMPILALSKLLVDHYVSKQYNNLSSINYIKRQFEKNSSSYDIDNNFLSSVLSTIIIMPYELDYFTSAFDNPNGPNNGIQKYNDLYITDESTMNANLSLAQRSQINVTNTGTPTIIQGDAMTKSPMSLSQYIIDSLKKLNDYLKRHQIAGNSTFDRFLARYGIGLNNEQMKYSVKIGEYESTIDFYDVMNNAETDDGSVGDYAGKGIGQLNGKSTYQSNEWGMYINLYYIVPKIGYYQGINRHIMHRGVMDFWTPEFDSLGTQPILQAELNALTMTDSNNITSSYTARVFENIFGFTPRYAEYKTKQSMLTGNFLFPTLEGVYDPWHVFRKINAANFLQPNGEPDFKHSYNFQMSSDYLQYNRIWISNKQDNFIIYNKYKMTITSKMLKLYDDYDFDSLGKEIEINFQGENDVH